MSWFSHHMHKGAKCEPDFCAKLGLEVFCISRPWVWRKPIVERNMATAVQATVGLKTGFVSCAHISFLHSSWVTAPLRRVVSFSLQSSVDSSHEGFTRSSAQTDKIYESQSSVSENSTGSGLSKKSEVVPNYLSLTDKDLFVQCKMDAYRASGPGGQHRNKTDSAVRIKHLPTGLVSQAADDRSQHVNRALALGRLRFLIAVEVRSPVALENYKPPPELLRILPTGAGVRRGSQKIGPNHPDFALGVQALLDLLWEVGGSVSDAATHLGLSTGAVSKLITSERQLWQGVNKLRASKGLKPLR